MSLASLTVDLTLSLAKFESDSGKAAQIVTRDQGTMTRGALALTQQIERLAASAGKSNTELLTIKAAAAGVSDATLALVQSVGAVSGGFGAIGSAGAAAFASVGAGADATSTKLSDLLGTMLSKTKELKAQADAARTAAVSQNSGGSLSDDGLKVQLAAIREVTKAEQQRLQAAYDADKAQLVAAAQQAEVDNQRAASIQKLIDLSQKFSYDQDVAAVNRLRAAVEAENAAESKAATDAAADAAQRAAAAQKIVDQQNGLTATYRTQLAALKELRDAGNLTPAQFKTAATDLVNKQPVVQQRNDASAAQDAAAAKASAQALAVAQAGNATATAGAQAQVYAAFLIAEAAAAEQAAAAAQHQADVAKAVADASARSQAAQQAAYETKTAFIAKLTEEADALFRTKDAQVQLDAVRAGVSQQQAAQLAKFAGDRDFIATIRDEIAAQETLRDEFGKTTEEILRQQAAARGLTNTTNSAITRYAALAAANKQVADAAATAKGNDAFLASLTQTADAVGKTRSQLLELQAAERGLSDQAAASIAKIKDFDAATGQLGKQAFGTKNQLQTLHYTLSDVVASLASGISPGTILLQQGGQVYDAFGQSTTAIFKTLGSLITPVRVAIGATAVAVGTLTYAFIEGAAQSKKFADSLVLTGNYAGQTEGQYNEMAKAVAASGQVTVASARDFGQALVSTGQIGPQVLEAATAAAAKYGKLTGQNAKDVAADYATMSADVAKWASDHNKSLNFITAAQYDQIKSLQEAGRTVDAEGIVFDALNARFSTAAANVGYLGRVLDGAKSLWSGFWDSAFDVGRADTIEQKIAKTRAAISTGVGQERVSQTQLDPERRAQLGIGQPDNAATSDAQETLRLLNKSQVQQRATAATNADVAAATQRAIASRPLIDAYAKEGKSVDLLKEKMDALLASFADNAKAGTPVSATKQAAAIKGLNDSFKDNKGIGEADAQRKADLAKSLQIFQAELDQEKDALKFHQDQLAALYSAGNISLKAFYDDRTKTTAEGVADELATLTKSQDAIRAQLAAGNFKDPHERTDLEKQLNESIAKSANVTRDADHAAALATLERVAATKALQDRVTSYYADLLSLEGNETDAAKLRTQQQINAAALLAKASQGSASPISDEDLARQTRALQIANQFAEVQRQVSIVTADASRSEESYTLRATQAGQTLQETEAGIYTIRATSLVQLGELADKAKALADASTDPKVIAYAADLQLQYAKAADAVDPAITRLRTGADDLATSFRGVFDQVSSGALTGSKAIDALGKSLEQTLTKTFIGDPLEAFLKGGFRQGLNSDNPISALLRGGAPSSSTAGGINVGASGYNPAKDSEAASEALDLLQTSTAAQTTVTQTATTSVGALATAAQGAAEALARVAVSGGGSVGFGTIVASGGAGSGISDAGGVNAGYPAYGLDVGTNYVPYDGFLAKLHKGESVTPAKYNPAVGGGWGRTGGGGPAQVQIINQGHPVNASSSSTSTGSDGTQLIKVVLGAVANDIGRGGKAAQAMQSKYGVKRQNPKRG